MKIWKYYSRRRIAQKKGIEQTPECSNEKWAFHCFCACAPLPPRRKVVHRRAVDANARSLLALVRSTHSQILCATRKWFNHIQKAMIKKETFAIIGTINYTRHFPHFIQYNQLFMNYVFNLMINMVHTTQNNTEDRDIIHSKIVRIFKWKELRNFQIQRIFIYIYTIPPKYI